MLSIGMVTAGGGRYYTELARADYYTAGGESPGTWHVNEAALAFGFHGTVEKQDIERLFDGYHPKTGKELAQNHGKHDRRAALDLCLSAPKDVSALWATSGEDERRRIEKAFERAVDQTLEFLSDQFGYTRRGHGGYEREKVDLLIAKFLHRQSRGQDPQLHAHCLALNTALRADGSFGTIDAGPLLAAKKMLGAYFRSALAAELGISLAPDQKFSFRVPGVPEALSEYWSSRAREIEAAARERGVDGAKGKAQIALETRRVKDEQPLMEVKERWRETAREYGLTERHVQQILNQPRPALTPKQAAKIIDAALESAVTQLTSQQAHFTKNDILRDVCVATVAAGISPRQIHERVEETLRQERFIDLGQHGQRFTTKEIFREVEQKALEAAERLGEKTSRAVRERTVAKAIARKPLLNNEQKAAIEMVCRGPDLTFIQGPPGSGKSTLFSVVRKAIEKDGGQVIGLTPSNRAARELEKSSGIKSFTLDRFLYDQQRTVADTAKHHAHMLVRAAFKLPTWKAPAKLNIDRRTTIIIDECAMADNEKLARALQAIDRAGCRVVLVGDHRQLPAIGQGGLFRELYVRAREEQRTELTKILRQEEEWAREAIHQVGRGEAAQALKTYEEKGRLHVAPSRDEAERRLVERWKGQGVMNPHDHLILASTNAEVDRLNQRAQEARREAWQLSLRSLRVGEERIHVNDRVLFTDTHKRLGLVKSEFATVTNIEWLTRQVTVQIDGQDKSVTFSLRQFDGLRLGYAATVHRAQGMTLDQNAYVLVGGSMQNREMSYVQLSRAKGESHLFVDEKSAGRDRAELERLIKRSDEKLSAHAIAREEQERQERQREEQQRQQQEREQQEREQQGPELSL